MRSMFRTVLAALATVLALSAIASASALASPEWYENGIAVKESKPITSEGEIIVETQRGTIGNIIKEELHCSVSGKGTVGTAGKGSITESKLTKCKKVGGPQCEEGQLITATAVHLPWKAQLAITNTGKWLNEQTGTAGSPGWKWECKTAVFGEEHFKNACEGGNPRAAIANESWGVLESMEGFSTQGAFRCKTGSGIEGWGIPYLAYHVKATGGVILSVK
jgi:hypothetical protein